MLYTLSVQNRSIATQPSISTQTRSVTGNGLGTDIEAFSDFLSIFTKK